MPPHFCQDRNKTSSSSSCLGLNLSFNLNTINGQVYKLTNQTIWKEGAGHRYSAQFWSKKVKIQPDGLKFKRVDHNQLFLNTHILHHYYPPANNGTTKTTRSVWYRNFYNCSTHLEQTSTWLVGPKIWKHSGYGALSDGIRGLWTQNIQVPPQT